MYGIIYKISNSINSKVYIGQTIRPLEERLKRHFHDAITYPDSQIHFHRAIRKYGSGVFNIIKIDEANSLEELNQKEQYWIQYYNSISNGYNEALGGHGGNTYAGKTIEELSSIKQKISIKNTGKNNGMSKQIKCFSVKTGEEFYFETVTACLKFFEIKNKNIIKDRATGLNNILWRHEWKFAYVDQDYNNYIAEYDSSLRKGTKVQLISDNETLDFNSKSKALKFLGLSKCSLFEGLKINNYTVHIIS